jgi:hypothetical protein
MLKVMGQIRRRKDLSLDAFRLHWRTIHRGLALRIAHAGIMRGYVQNHRLDIPVDGLEPVADGVPELWFDDATAFASLRNSSAFRDGAFHDEPRFMDIGDYRSLLLGPESHAAGPPRRDCVGLLKAMFFLPSGESMGSSGSTSRILGEATPVRASWHPRSDAPSKVTMSNHAGVETSWWSDLDSFLIAWARRTVHGPVAGMLVDERPIFWPGDILPQADWRPVLPTRSML